MSHTNFWLIRHALVAENARATLYGSMDVELCPHGLESQTPSYASLARRLPKPADWVVTPLSRTRLTADAILRAGYPATPYSVEPDLIEQDLGEWQGLLHADLGAKLQIEPPPFWHVAGSEVPPGGESMAMVLDRVGATLERLAKAHSGGDVVIVSHGGAIRAAVAHALAIDANHALNLSVENLSLTRMERHDSGWRVVCVNEMADLSGVEMAAS